MRPILLLAFLALAGRSVAAKEAKEGNTMTKTAKAQASAANNAGHESLEPLFRAVLQQRSDSDNDAVVPAEGHEGAYIGSGDGIVTGKRLRGTMQWTFYAGDCLYPSLRKGQKPPAGFHLCTISPGGFIETHDGARIRFEGRGYGLLSPDKYRVSTSLTFGTDDPRYAWLTKLLGVVEGEVDAKAGRSTWNAYTPSP